MDPVSSLNAIALLLRKQLMEKGRSRAAGGRAASRTAAVAGQQVPLEAEVQVALEALQVAPVDSEGQALRRVIQLILRQHFGLELENDAGFQNMVNAVSTTLSEDAELVSVLKQR